MANHGRDAHKEQHWRSVVAEQATSGLSVREFCRQRGVKENSFYAWRRTLARRDGKLALQPRAAKPPAFVKAIVANSPPGETLSIELASGITLKLPPTMAVAAIADLVLRLAQRGGS